MVAVLALDADGFTKKHFGHYRYMHLRTYAKFTFCIKSPRHVSDETFYITVYT